MLIVANSIQGIAKKMPLSNGIDNGIFYCGIFMNIGSLTISLLQNSADIAEGVFDAGGMEGFVVVDDVAGGTTAIEKVVGLAALGAVNPFVFFNTID